MKLWLLEPVRTLPVDDNPWEPWYDKAFGFVVRAETEAEARALAQAEGGDEIYGPNVNDCPAWTDNRYSTCVELLPDGPIGVVLRDFASA